MIREADSNQGSIVAQLAAIAARLDSILSSMRAEVEEIKAQMIGDGCNSEESNCDLKNPVAEEPQGSEPDRAHQLGPECDSGNKISGTSEIAGAITDRNEVVDDEIGGTDEMDGEINDRMDADEIAKIKGTRLDDWGAAKDFAAHGSRDQKGRENVVLKVMVLLPGGLSPMFYEEFVQFINKGFMLHYHACTMVPQLVSSPLLFMTTTTPQKPRTVVVYFIIVWDPGKELNEYVVAAWVSYDLFRNQLPYHRLEDKSFRRPGCIDTILVNSY